MKDIFLFFKDIPNDRMRDIGPSLQQVLDFRSKVREEKKLFYTEFNALEIFRQKIGDALSKIGWDSSNRNSSTDIAAPSGRITEDVKPATEKPTNNNDYYFPYQTRKFLDLVKGRRGDYNIITNVDVARLRLISSSIMRGGNDEIYIGVHDANLLYRHRAELNFSEADKATLLIAGLRQMEHENVPLWCWTGGDVEVVERLVQAGMMMEDESATISALRIAAKLGYSPMPARREFCIQNWFNDRRANGVRNAAQSYLSRCATCEDIPTLQGIRDDSTGQKASELDGIIVAVKFRCSPSDGLSELKKRNPEQISSVLREILQNLIRGLSSAMLEELARLKAEYIRLISIKELSRRNALSRQLAEELSGDDSTEVRLEALKALSDMLVPISESSAREALVIQRANQGLLAGFLRGGGDFSDTLRFEEYQRHLLKRKPLQELVVIEEEDTPFDADALLSACQVFPRNTGKLLRAVLMDGFEGRFESRLKRLPPGMVKRARDLKRFCCLRQTRAALDILAAQLKREDLSLIREVMDRSEIEASREILAYLGRFGSWEDVDRILKLTPKVSGLLEVDHAENEELIGRALCKVGSVRMVDLIDKIDSVTIRAAAIKACTQTVFLGLSDEKLLELMNEENDKIRRLTTIKCLISLPKYRIKKLFSMYMNGQDYRYYNTIHWLDLGVSMTRSIVRKVARQEINAA